MPSDTCKPRELPSIPTAPHGPLEGNETAVVLLSVWSLSRGAGMLSYAYQT